MRDAGYQYINLDDSWQADQRDEHGNLTGNRKFPDMKALADYVHGKGLKLGIYSSAGPDTCEGYRGSYGREDQDARTFAAWGIDYLKYGWCSAGFLYRDGEIQAVDQRMGEALQKSGRPIVFSLAGSARSEVWKWGSAAGANVWRTSADLRDAWESIARNGFGEDPLASWAGPGRWNDPGVLKIGADGMSSAESRTQISLWAMLAAPLLAGNDLGNYPPPLLTFSPTAM